MDDIWRLAGWALLGLGLLGALVEPLVIGRIAENFDSLRERKRMILAFTLFSNLAAAGLGVLLLLYGSSWFGS